jgi:uncharacterized protein (TIGR02300 family)
MAHLTSRKRPCASRRKGFDSSYGLWQVARIACKTEEFRKGSPMPKEEWGVKRVCPTTGKRFYDLNQSPIISPYTGEVVEIDTGKTRTITADTEDAETAKTKSSDSGNESQEMESDVEVDLGDDVLEDDDDSNVSLDDIADVSGEDNES